MTRAENLRVYRKKKADFALVSLKAVNLNRVEIYEVNMDRNRVAFKEARIRCLILQMWKGLSTATRHYPGNSRIDKKNVHLSMYSTLVGPLHIFLISKYNVVFTHGPG